LTQEANQIKATSRHRIAVAPAPTRVAARRQDGHWSAAVALIMPGHMIDTAAEIAMAMSTWEAVPVIALVALVLVICIAVIVDLVAKP